jgi:parallel beta-helix repeat protein
MNFKSFNVILKLTVVCIAVSIQTLAFAQSANLKVSGDVTAQNIIFNPLTSAPAAAAGRMYYNADHYFYYYDGSVWQRIGSGKDRTIGYKIMAGSGTLDVNRANIICNGDDQQDINQAILDLPASGGVVYLLEGTYDIAASITINKSNVALIGTGKGAKLKLRSGSSDIYFINANNVSNIVISNLMIDGASQGSGNRGINFKDVTSSRIENVWLEHTKGIGIYLDNSSNNVITNNNLRFNTGENIFLTNSSSRNYITMNTEYYGLSNNAVYLKDSSNHNVVSNNSIYSAEYSGILVDNSLGNYISGNFLFATQHDGIGVNNSPVNSSGHIISGNVLNGSQPSYSAININNTESTLVTENIITSITDKGISVKGSDRNSIIGNLLYQQSNVNFQGIRVEDGSEYNLIGSNYIGNFGKTAQCINIASSSCANNYLATNDIYGSLTDAGSQTKYTDTSKLSFERSIPQDPCTLGILPLTGNSGVTSYIPLNPTSDCTVYDIGSGLSNSGQMLILENISASNTITFQWGGLWAGTDKKLGPGEIATFIFRYLCDDSQLPACDARWIQTGYSRNDPPP